MYLNIFPCAFVLNFVVRLTVTWDVFKCFREWQNRYKQSGLTVTWDVFKWKIRVDEDSIFRWLTVTWDVFKLSRELVTNL